MKQKLFLLITVIALAGLSYFIFYSFVTSSPPPQIAVTPDIANAPVRVYGIVEPAGREVFVSPPVTKRVVEVSIKEGDRVEKGQTLCVFENAVEFAQWEASLARIQVAKSALALSRDEMKRKESLYRKKVNSEYEFTRAKLQEELDKCNLLVAQREEKIARARLEELKLKAPIDGKVYKCDVRLGETLSAGDNTRIILGSSDLWVRLFVESFWRERISKGLRYKIYDAETQEYIGLGEVVYKLPYMGRRNFRTDDSQERFDTKFQEVVLVPVKKEREDIPIGLSVVAELSRSEIQKNKGKREQ